MREPFAHDAVISLGDGADVRAPGGAITVELCGGWTHDPPCPLAPHHTGAEPVGDEVHLRILFATEPGREAEVRERITRALAGGRQIGPDGHESRWTLRRSEPGEITPAEADHAGRLVASG